MYSNINAFRFFTYFHLNQSILVELELNSNSERERKRKKERNQFLKTIHLHQSIKIIDKIFEDQRIETQPVWED